MENGQRKEGGEFQANNRMKRTDYDKICEEHIK
jgi:hypothetical protein